MASKAIKTININITADSICPFCYLGFTKVNKAISTAQAKSLPLEFHLKFAPYQLDPTLPSDQPLSKRERYGAKFGEARFEQMEKMMAERFASEGLAISYDGTVRQTTLSHRIIAKAYQEGGEQLQLATVAAIYKKYFSEGKDIGDVEVMAPLAVDIGVFKDLDGATSWLKGSEGMEEYEKGVEKARRERIQGVPYFRINEKWGISGAQEPETFLQVFERIASGELA